nr:hypothetical protein BaRGS_025184 [Batillaria attramentaria]
MPDFDVTRKGYEFVYHDTNDLLLTIHDNKCYFAYFEDGSAEEHKLYRHRDQVEDLMIKIIEANDTQAVTPSSLDDVRVKFEDLLADFRCTGLDVYTVVFEAEFKTAHHKYTEPNENNSDIEYTTIPLLQSDHPKFLEFCRLAGENTGHTKVDHDKYTGRCT